MIKKIGVLTSGGDAPGMNAAIRAVVRAGIKNGFEVYGIHDGYKGMYEGTIERLYRKSVSEKINRGGTFLGTARLENFSDIAVRKIAIENLQRYGIDALVVIGGDGTFRGALALSEMGIRTIGVPGTIDNDINGTEFTIGFDTALNTVIENVDKLRDTSNSHKRCSIIEVMGRNCGAIAVWTGIAVGAEAVICKETGYNEQEIIDNITAAAATKRHAIIIVAEKMLDVDSFAKFITKNTPFEARSTILGHIQRGGIPTGRDRVLASMMGSKAIDALMNDESGVCICVCDGKLVTLPIMKALNEQDSQVIEKYKVFKTLW